MNCTNKNQYSKGGKCCDRCPAGEYVQEDCDSSKPTKCAKCEYGNYLATENHLYKCQVCTECGSHNKKREVSACTATRNTMCACLTGFYCSSHQCDHCLPLTECDVGKGVIRPATRTTDVECAPCPERTYSNVSDYLSPCKPHTKCEEMGRSLEVVGTSETDAICGDVLPRCSWMLPAGLWSGLVLTALVLFAVVICRRAKRRSYKAGRTSVPVTLTEVVPAPLELPLPATELNGHCQESCKLPLFNPDENLVNCSMDSSLPITPFKASVSFVESSHTNGSFLRTYSEPQEDEWCGT